MTPAIMSSQTLNNITDELQRAYNTALLQIVNELRHHEQEKLQRYYKGLIPSGIDGTLHILSSLEDAGKISWTNVRWLKEGLREIQRSDLAETLTAFETQRDLTVFLDAYASKRNGLETQRYKSASSIELLARNLIEVTSLTTGVYTDGFENRKVRSLMESKKNVRELMFDFAEKIEKKTLNAWSKLTLLVVIAGEIVAEVFMMPVIDAEWQPETEVLKFCSKFCYARLKKLGNWVS